jgi:hypothetical protein
MAFRTVQGLKSRAGGNSGRGVEKVEGAMMSRLTKQATSSCGHDDVDLVEQDEFEANILRDEEAQRWVRLLSKQ